MTASNRFENSLWHMLANDPAVTAMCEQIELQERHDLARLDDRDTVSYGELRSKGMTHGDAIVWLDRARPLRERASLMPETPDFEKVAPGPTLTGLPDLHPDAIGATVQGVYYTREQYEALRAQGKLRPETPDFDQIAERLIDRAFYADDGTGRSGTTLDEARAVIIEQLRLVWNARGAADLAKIESMGSLASGPYGYLKNVDRALRSLDR